MMKLHRIARLVAVAGLIISLSACAREYSAAAITARVVDLETGKPLEGVHVVADWQLQGGLEGGNYMGSVKTMEQTTDELGEFHFPAWGPIDLPQPWSLTSDTRIQSLGPELILFKPGFKYEVLSNELGEDPNPHGMRSRWDGQTVKLMSFKGTPTQYLEHVRFLSDHLQTTTAKVSETCSTGRPCPAACQWQNIPSMIRAVGQELSSTYKTVKGYINSGIQGDLIRSDETYRARGCSSPIAVFGDGKK